jgi:hypothetical protein
MQKTTVLDGLERLGELHQLARGDLGIGEGAFSTNFITS